MNSEQEPLVDINKATLVMLPLVCALLWLIAYILVPSEAVKTLSTWFVYGGIILSVVLGAYMIVGGRK